MSRRRHRRKNQNAIKLNVTAMLDMAFQLLAFFILTFKPAPIEGHLSLNMPPPVPLTNIASEPTVGKEGSGMIAPLHALHLFVSATDNGDVAQVRLESAVLSSGRLTPGVLAGIDRQLRPLFARGNAIYDRIQIEVDRDLRYEELLKLVDVCAQQKMPDDKPLGKVSFVEMRPR
ncbi:MAG: ExbD/TolR family protein [Planctomycetaceae bacterium]